MKTYDNFLIKTQKYYNPNIDFLLNGLQNLKNAVC